MGKSIVKNKCRHGITIKGVSICSQKAVKWLLWVHDIIDYKEYKKYSMCKNYKACKAFIEGLNI